MRIVCVGDTHGKTFPVPDGDVFIHVGDLCRKSDLDETRAQAQWIETMPHAHKIVVAGNHDWPLAHCTRARVVCKACSARGLSTCEVASRERVLAELFGARQIAYLEDAELVVDGVRFYGTPWQANYHEWAFNLPPGAPMRGVWAQIPDGIDVLITHVPPTGYGDRLPSGERIGDDDLLARSRAVAPRLHVFGHLHQDGGAWHAGATLYANVTTWEDLRAPTIFDLDVGTHAVTATHVPPSTRWSSPTDAL